MNPCVTPALQAWKNWLLLCVACCLIAPGIGAHNSSSARIAIVGAGVGGSSAAWFLRDLLGPATQIDVFESGDIGGRTQTYVHNGTVYEMGASIIHAQNAYFRDLADMVGLEREALGADSSQLSIFDGQRFVFHESSCTLVTLWRMLWRYGLSYLYMRSGPSEMLQRYLQLYRLQAEGMAFRTPEELLRAVDLFDLTQRSFRDELEGRIGASQSAQRFASEFVAGINRIQYNQGNGINALAGMVSLLPSIDGRLFRIKGGNRLLPERLLRAARANLHGQSRVMHIQRHAPGNFSLQVLQAEASQKVFAGYAAVLVAVPLELTQLTFGGLKVPDIPVRTYQTTVTTLLEGRLRPEYFKVPALSEGEQYIMVSEDAQTPFSVIGPQRQLPDGLVIFKLFSQAVLKEQLLQTIFSNLTVLAQREWQAYPKFRPPEAFPPFELTHGLYLNNAWENAASAMEMSTVAAKNCALLIAQQQLKKGALIRASANDVLNGMMKAELR